MDWASRRVLSWRVSNTMDSAFCVEALDATLRSGVPEIFNTDQGAQFTGTAFTERARACGARCSMDGRGRHARRRLPGHPGERRASRPGAGRPGNATPLAVSTRFAGPPPLRCGPSGDTASAAAKRSMTTGRVLPVVIDRLSDSTTAGTSTMPLTSSAPVGRFCSPTVQDQSEYTLIQPSDCPRNQDHLTFATGKKPGSGE